MKTPAPRGRWTRRARARRWKRWKKFLASALHVHQRARARSRVGGRVEARRAPQTAARSVWRRPWPRSRQPATTAYSLQPDVLGCLRAAGSPSVASSLASSCSAHQARGVHVAVGTARTPSAWLESSSPFGDSSTGASPDSCNAVGELTAKASHCAPAAARSHQAASALQLRNREWLHPKLMASAVSSGAAGPRPRLACPARRCRRPMA